MANLAKFKQLLSREAQASGGLPNVVLKQTTDLGQAFSRVVTLDNRHQGEDNAQVTGRYVDEFCAALGSESNSEAISVFDQTCEAFTDKIREAWNSLEGIKEMSKDLGAEMDKVAGEIIANDPYISTHAKFTQLSQDFPVFGWQGTKIMGAKADIAAAVNGLVMAGNDDGIPSDLDQRVFDIVISGLEKWTAVANVNVDEEGRTAIIDQMKEVCDGVSGDTIAECFDYLTGIRKYTDVYNTLKYIGSNPAVDLFNTVKKFDDFICGMFPILDAVASEQVKCTPEVQGALVANAQKMITFCKIASYYEMMQRDSVFKESVLLQGGLVNSDLKETFEQNGGNNRMLACHVREMYQDEVSKIPAMGIRGDAIIKADAYSAVKVEKEMEVINSRIALSKTNARVSAFKRVAMDYVSKIVDRDCQGLEPMVRSNKINDIMSKYALDIANSVRQYNICLTEAALNLVVSIDYKDTFVEHLKDKLGAAYLAVANTTNDVTDSNIQCAEVSVIADLVCEFVASRMVDVVPCKERPAIPAASSEVIEGPLSTPEEPVKSPEEIKEQPNAEPAQES